MALDLHVGTVDSARIAALVDDGGLVGLAAEPVGHPDLGGAVYRARVAGHRKAADYTIVDLGPAEALLPGRFASARPFPVQIQRSARADKLPEATTDIILPGRFVMAAPGLADVRPSRHLRDPETQKDRARRLGLTAGWILRRTFAAADDGDIQSEIDRLGGLVRRIERDGEPGPLLPPCPLWCRLVLDQGEPSRLFAHAAQAAMIRSDLAGLGIDAPVAGAPCDLAELIAPLRRPVVDLPQGGRLTIEPTRALTAIDVDAGGARHEAANQAAIAAVARQLRLRNIGGIVVIDLVSQKSDWRPLVAGLRRLLEDDPARTRIVGGISPLGLLQLSRERRGLSLSEALGPPAMDSALPDFGIANQ